MSFDEFKLCKGCPVKGARYWDPDGYWCCKHPEAANHEYPGENGESGRTSLYEPGDPIPFVCMKTCPAGHWKRTIEGGQIPKGQIELVTDAEREA